MTSNLSVLLSPLDCCFAIILALSTRLSFIGVLRRSSFHIPWPGYLWYICLWQWSVFYYIFIGKSIFPFWYRTVGVSLSHPGNCKRTIWWEQKFPQTLLDETRVKKRTTTECTFTCIMCFVFSYFGDLNSRGNEYFIRTVVHRKKSITVRAWQHVFPTCHSGLQTPIWRVN